MAPSGKHRHELVYTGEVARQTPCSRRALDLPIRSPRDNRWSSAGDPHPLYTASTPSAALRELTSKTTASLVGHKRRLALLRISGLLALDLTDERVLAERGLNVRGLMNDPALCRRLAREACDEGYEGIVAPSAASSGDHVVIVFAESIARRVTVLYEETVVIPPDDRTKGTA
jgi:RES domain-containing protein